MTTAILFTFLLLMALSVPVAISIGLASVLGVQFFTQRYGDLIHLQITAAAMAIIPIIVLYLFLQRQFIQGITITGLKG